MICCFMNFHERENFNDLAHHFDNEILYAIFMGCTTFYSGKKYPEDKLFAERVRVVSECYPNAKIELITIDKADDELKEYFIEKADWEIYSYNCA